MQPHALFRNLPHAQTIRYFLKHSPLLSLWMALLVLCGFSPPPNKGHGNLEIVVALQYAGQPLLLGKQLYRSANGDSFYVDVLRFYLSSVQLQGKGLEYREKDGHHLIDAEDGSTQTIVLKDVPAGVYQLLCLDVGTDSLTNVSGAMGGDLDPSLGMYWAWNSGYINAKVEGRSNACKTLHYTFAFHIGGYKPPHQTLRRLTFPLKNIKIRQGATTSVRIRADLAKFFGQIRLEKTNQVMIPGKQGAQLADGFKQIFLKMNDE